MDVREHPRRSATNVREMSKDPIDEGCDSVSSLPSAIGSKQDQNDPDGQ